MFALDFSIRNVSNVVSVSRFRLALRMIPTKLKRRCTGADEEIMVLYFRFKHEPNMWDICAALSDQSDQSVCKTNIFDIQVGRLLGWQLLLIN